MFSRAETREQNLFSQTAGQHFAILAERDAAAGVDGLDDSAGFEGRLVVCLVCHHIQCALGLETWTIQHSVQQRKSQSSTNCT